MPPEDQLRLASKIFSLYPSSQNLSMPGNSLMLVAQGMAQLKDAYAGRSNVLYSAAKGLGTKRSDGCDSVFPSKHVVTGLVEHCVNFFTVSFVRSTNHL